MEIVKHFRDGKKEIYIFKRKHLFKPTCIFGLLNELQECYIVEKN